MVANNQGGFMANESNQKTKPNNGPIYAIVAAVVVVIVAIIIGVVIINNNRDDDDKNKNQSTSQTENSNSATNNSQSNGNAQTNGNVTAAELANVDVVVEYGNYDAMQTLSKDIQNGRMTGKVVKIDGLVSHPGTKYSIVQPNASGSQKIGTEFVIEDSADYPHDGERAVVVGKVIEKEPAYFIIVTLDDFVDDVDGPNDD